MSPGPAGSGSAADPTGADGSAGAFDPTEFRRPVRGAQRDVIARRMVLFGLPWLLIPLTFITSASTGEVIVQVAAIIIMGALWAVLVLRSSLTPLQRWTGVTALTVAAIAIDALLGPGWGVVAVFATTAASWVLPRRSALIVIGTVGAVSVLGLMREGTMDGKLLDMLLPVVIGLGMIALVEFIDLTELVRRQQEDLRAMAVLAERNRIARDLHDSIGHSLMAVLVQVRLLRARAAAIKDDRIPDLLYSLNAVESSVRDASGDVRRAIADYRSFDVFTMLESVPSTLRAANVNVQLDAQPRALKLLREHPSISEALGWVLREGATNVLRHSSARSARILIREPESERRFGVSTVELVLVNDGVRPGGPFDAPGGGSGVAGMRNRVERIGGTLLVEPSDDSFTLTACVPLTTERGPDRAS
ncbi:sensor histidine kinase [Rathayibacter toxicus]|uniref:Signal transduction histidine kinase subgroup 3 dimerisation and phosphoacceptor domain-containing protein n=1 Tax=Rathayibacter toxicus TaxID=145458 RepID=A0A2S5Y7G8_9MICO|nr:histidine kinase [Rathayibacter toxicus]PPI15397.1 hypothetical protein C5C51_06425 [Rathayibacter toxicus]QWL49025.1 hypothetical protein E2R43_04955 [Rathayibacter toxicus]QWL53424.1 hypothetical protein E2R45_04960 [Rathayibacter toxicus]